MAAEQAKVQYAEVLIKVEEGDLPFPDGGSVYNAKAGTCGSA